MGVHRPDVDVCPTDQWRITAPIGLTRGRCAPAQRLAPTLSAFTPRAAGPTTAGPHRIPNGSSYGHASPQAPPAITQGTNQESIDAVSRLVDTHAWLLDQQTAVPVTPELRSADALATYLTTLDAFWAASVANADGGPDVPRSAALASRLASLMRDEAVLRVADGTLTPEAGELALRFARSRGGSLPPGLHAAELLLDGAPDIGAVVVTDERMQDLALLFTPARGWDAFGSLAELHEETEYRVNLDIAQGTPPRSSRSKTATCSTTSCEWILAKSLAIRSTP